MTPSYALLNQRAVRWFFPAGGGVWAVNSLSMSSECVLLNQTINDRPWDWTTLVMERVMCRAERTALHHLRDPSIRASIRAALGVR